MSQQHKRHHKRRLDSRAVATAAALSVSMLMTPRASAFTCPTTSPTPPSTLSMNCLGACPNVDSPCLFYANTTACSGFQQQHGTDDATRSICILGTSNNSAIKCAIECLSPFSGPTNESWNLQLVTAGEGFGEDVVERALADPFFRVATRPVEWLKHIAAGLTFAPTTTQVYVYYRVD